MKHLKLDRWEDSQLEQMKEIGNIKAKKKYENKVPAFYRRPKESDPQYVYKSIICSTSDSLTFYN